MTEKREYRRDEPVALDDIDPGNSDPDAFTEPLSPDDDVFSRVNPDQGPLETTPVQAPTYGN
jgi:hypothetical protein